MSLHEPTDWVILPPGSHLRLGDDERMGVDVVALRTGLLRSERAEVLTERGEVVSLADDRRLRIGESKP